MKVFVLKVELRANWVHSLKEKRMVVKSIIQRLKNKFNISVCEVEEQDIHQKIVIGICGIGGSSGVIDSTIENIITFIENNCDAEMLHIEREVEEY